MTEPEYTAEDRQAMDDLENWTSQVGHDSNLVNLMLGRQRYAAVLNARGGEEPDEYGFSTEGRARAKAWIGELCVMSHRLWSLESELYTENEEEDQ